ncbi:MAG: hypothetical protein KKF41_06075 [Actinobacteria bacterium]|nr:hypothetical protein [Actinomycetota bacterium]MBU2687131.1 hypothetical protein [Actinomycetota bacterium]
MILSSRSSLKLAVAVPCIVALALAVASCGGEKTSSAPTSTPNKPSTAALAVANTWTLDNQTHIEPMTVPGITCTTPNTLFVALIASDSGQGPERGGPPLDCSVQNVEGGGLTWTRRAEAHLSITGAPCVAEVWTACAPAVVQPFTLTVTRNNNAGGLTYCDNYSGGSGPDIANGMVVVQAITGADPSNPVGATAVNGVGQFAGNVAPASVTLTTTRPGSMVVAVGADWSAPEVRTLPDGQVMIHEDLSTPNGDAYWAQGLNSLVATPGPVTLSVTAPTEDSCNMAAIEVLQAP